MIFDNVRLYEALAVPSVALLVLLAVLTMRAIVKRDRAMMFGKTQGAQARRLSYENTWRNNNRLSA